MRSGLATVWCAAGLAARREGHSRLCALCQAYQCALWQHADLSPIQGAFLSVWVCGESVLLVQVHVWDASPCPKAGCVQGR